jgi:hypothetical protein
MIVETNIGLDDVGSVTQKAHLICGFSTHGFDQAQS